MAYRGGKQLTPVGCLVIGWFCFPIVPAWVFNATGSGPLALAAWLLPGVILIGMNEGVGAPPTRVYFGPRGGAYRINSNGRKSYDVTDEEIRRSREYYDKPDED